MPDSIDPIAEAQRQWNAHGWTESAEGMALVTSVVRVQQLFSERIESVLRPLELTFARFELLRLLAFSRAGAMPMSKIGALLQVHATSVTSAVARLEAQGFVTRTRSDADGRVVLAELTNAGRQRVEQATERLNSEVFASPGIAPDAVVALTAQLGAIRRAWGDPVAD